MTKQRPKGDIMSINLVGSSDKKATQSGKYIYNNERIVTKKKRPQTEENFARNIQVQ